MLPMVWIFPLDPLIGGGDSILLIGPELAGLAPTFRNPNLTRTFPPTPIPASVVCPPPPVPSVIPNSLPRTLRTASSALRPKIFKFPFDSCSKCSRTSINVAVGGKVPVDLRGGSAHCNANVIGLEAIVRLRQGRRYGEGYLLRR